MYEQQSVFLPKIRQLTKTEKKEYRKMTEKSKQLTIDVWLEQKKKSTVR